MQIHMIHEKDTRFFRLREKLLHIALVSVRVLEGIVIMVLVALAFGGAEIAWLLMVAGKLTLLLLLHLLLAVRIRQIRRENFVDMLRDG